MSITKTFEDEIEKFFEYELAPYPLSLFDALGIRKTPKSAIYDCFKSVNAEIDTTNKTSRHPARRRGRRINRRRHDCWSRIWRIWIRLKY